MAPIKEDALPALSAKGASESAEELGKVNPWQHRKTKMSAIELYKPSQPIIAPTNKATPVNV